MLVVFFKAITFLGLYIRNSNFNKKTKKKSVFDNLKLTYTGLK